MPTLQWLGREEAVTAAEDAPFRLLEHDPGLSAGDTETENLVIQGDNLEALKALLPVYAGRVRCIYIDPPYNTGSAFKQYDDNIEHSTWLSLMYPRLELLRDFLTADGSIWISVDDAECHYLKVIGDEVFARDNFIIDVAWRKRDGAPNDRKIGSVHEHILVWGNGRNGSSKKTLAEERFNLMPRTEKADKQYRVFNEPDGPDPRGPFRKIDTTANAKGGRDVKSLHFGILNPYTNEEVFPRPGTCWRHSKDEMIRLQADRRLYWGVKGTATTTMRKLFKFEAKQGMTTPSIWEDVGLNQHASQEIERIFGTKAAFETPKPEGLVKRIVEVASNADDFVLDSFLGSGTTAAVAHKMGRRYIGVEMGEHAETHCAPRLRKVVEGDAGGISESVKWKGGGGFRFMRLGPPVFDDTGVLNADIRFPNLAAHIWFSETHSGWTGKADSPLLGVHKGTAYYLLFNGILGDRRPGGGNVLNTPTFKMLPAHDGPKVIYGEWSQWRADRLRREGITFKMIPYEIKVR